MERCAMLLAALFRLRVADPGRARLAHSLLLEGFIGLRLLDRRAVLLARQDPTSLRISGPDTPPGERVPGVENPPGRAAGVDAYLAAHEPAHHARPNDTSAPVVPAGGGAPFRPRGGEAGRGVAGAPGQPRPHSRAFGPARRAGAQGGRRAPGAVRPSVARRLPRLDQALALPDAAEPLRPVRVRPGPDHRPGPGALPCLRRARLRQGQAQARGGHEVRLDVGKGPLPDPPGRAEVRLPARMAALVPPRDARQALWGRDGLRPGCASQLSPASGHSRRRAAGDPRTQDASAVARASPGRLRSALLATLV